jgi:hypothetical protein
VSEFLEVKHAEIRGHAFSDLGPGKTVPDDPSHFGTPMMVLIGPADDVDAPDGTPTGEWFDFFVCTPSWLGENLDKRGYEWGRHMLIVREWDEGVFVNAVERLCAVAPGADWTAVAEFLAKFGQWEFDKHAYGAWQSP